MYLVTDDGIAAVHRCPPISLSGCALNSRSPQPLCNGDAPYQPTANVMAYPEMRHREKSVPKICVLYQRRSSCCSLNSLFSLEPYASSREVARVLIRHRIRRLA